MIFKRWGKILCIVIIVAALGIGAMGQDYYQLLKQDCANNHDIYYEDFNEAFQVWDVFQNQWSINGETWWFPHHNGQPPVTQDSFLFLYSEKNESNSTFIKQEAQTIERFSLPDQGELIIGLWSDRWGKYPELPGDHWADSSVGLEFFIGSQHYAVVFVYGHMGIFYDPTGNCQHEDAVCQYARVEGWSTIATTNTPIALRIAWTTCGDNKTFNLYIITENSQDTEPRAVISNVNYIDSEALRFRLNANVTDTDKEPPIDSDTLKIDYVCLRSRVTGPDFNSDGIDDIIWRYHGAGGYNAVWLMEKNGFNNASQLSENSGIDFPFGSAALSSGEPTYSSVTDPRDDPKSVELLAVADQNWMLCGTGDFNGDCKIDIVWSNLSTLHNCVWYMDGTSFSGYGQLPYGANTDWVLGGVGDFNRDGKPDLIWNNKTDGRNGVWLMDGVTLIETVIMTTSANLDWELCGTGDFDCDGQVDLVWRNTSDGRNAVWYMDGVELSSVGWLPTVENQNWKLRGTGDFNGDGKIDLIWRHHIDGSNAIWYLDGVTFIGVEFLTTVTDTDWKIEN